MYKAQTKIVFKSFVYSKFDMLAVKPKGELAQVSKKPKKVNYLWETIKQTWTEFSNCSSVHGIRYVVDPDGTMVTKVLWIIIVTVSLITSNVLVSTFWSRYRSNPTRMNVETNHAPIQQLPFPAVTFCSTNLISYLKARSLVETLVLPENLTESMVLQYFGHTAGFAHRIDYDSEELDKLQDVLTANRYDVSSAMEKMRISCRDLLFKCRWEDQMIDCMKLFRRSMTYNGFCCSFNLAPYNKNNFKPFRPRYFGIGRGLTVVIQPNNDQNAISKVYSEGVQLMIHESNTYPSDTTSQKMLPFRAETAISIKPSITKCSNQVKALSISARECVFPEEYSLLYFSQYRETNCEVECRMIKTMEKCECLPYLYPNYINFPVCNFTRIECLVNHYFELHETQKVAANSSCDCPASCNGIFYDTIADTVPLVLNNLSKDSLYNGVNDSHLVVHIFMDAQVYKRMRRDLLTNIIGLVANFGGVYSLFLGLSVIGLFEFLYFLTIRFYKNFCNIKLVLKQKAIVDKLGEASKLNNRKSSNSLKDKPNFKPPTKTMEITDMEEDAPSYNETVLLNPYTMNNNYHHGKLYKNEIVNHM